MARTERGSHGHKKPGKGLAATRAGRASQRWGPIREIKLGGELRKRVESVLERIRKAEAVIAKGRFPTAAVRDGLGFREVKVKGVTGPESLKEATSFVTTYVNMARFPTVCTEWKGWFLFSGGRHARKDVSDFSTGYAIRRGDKMIFSWNSADTH